MRTNLLKSIAGGNSLLVNAFFPDTTLRFPLLLVIRLGGAHLPLSPKATHLQLIQGQSSPPPPSFKRAAHSAAPRQFVVISGSLRWVSLFLGLYVCLSSSPSTLCSQPLLPAQTQYCVQNIKSWACFCVFMSVSWVQSPAWLNTQVHI